MAASLLFDYVATYMYEDDTPAAERRAQALSLDRELLRELLGQEELRDLLDPGALAEVEALAAARRRGTPTSCTTSSAAWATSATTSSTRASRRRSSASAARSARRSAGEDALIAAEDAGLYRDALGVMPPGGLPEAFLEPVDDALDRSCSAFARGRGPFTTGEVAARYGLEPRRRGGARRRSSARDLLVRGELRPGGVEREWCDPDVLRRIRRASLAALRREVEPAEQAALGASSPAGTASTAARRSARRSSRCRGWRCPWRSGRREVLPRRVPGYRPASARPALRDRRGRLGRRRPRPRRRSSSATTRPSSAAARGEPPPEAGARRRPGGARRERRLLARAARPRRPRRGRTPCRRSGSSSGRAR